MARNISKYALLITRILGKKIANCYAILHVTNNMMEINLSGIRQPIYRMCSIEESMYHHNKMKMGGNRPQWMIIETITSIY